MMRNRDVTLGGDNPTDLLIGTHDKYLRNFSKNEDGHDQIMSEYLKMSAMYWGLNALYIMRTLDKESSEIPKTLEFIKQCQTDGGGFAAAPGHDPHILHTLSAIQMLVILDKLDSEYIDSEKCVSYIKSLQQKDGSFFGDKWGEVDTRFSFCGLATLKLLNRLDAIDLSRAVEFVMLCNNQIDGGFGSKPGSESHTAYVYCCLGSLAIADQLDRVDVDLLGWWLSERQLPSGGLNGRPEKLPDLCYSWWCLSSMQMINKMHLIDHKKLLSFILACQDEELGGFSDRPNNFSDPYHTMFGVASISLICQYYKQKQDKPSDKIDQDTDFINSLNKFIEKLRPVNPVLCMPEESLMSLMRPTSSN